MTLWMLPVCMAEMKWRSPLEFIRAKIETA